MALASEGAEGGGDVGFAAPELCAQVDGREGPARGREEAEDVGFERREVLLRAVAGIAIRSEMRDGVGQEPAGDGFWSRGATVLDREDERVSAAGEEEVRVGPGCEVAAAAQCEVGLGGGRLSSVVNDEDGDGKVTL